MKSLNLEFVLKLILANYGGRPISIDRLLYLLFIVDSSFYNKYKKPILNLKWEISAILESEDLYEKIEELNEFRIMTSYNVNEQPYELLYYIGEGEKIVFNMPELNFINHLIRENIFLRNYELESKVKDSQFFKLNQFQTILFGSTEDVRTTE